MARHHLAAAALLAAIVAAWAVAMALVLQTARLPDEAGGLMLAAFAPLTGAEESFRAIAAAGGRPVRPVARFIWVAYSDEPGLAGRLRAQGARFVVSDFAFGPALAGCLAYVGEANERRRRP